MEIVRLSRGAAASVRAGHPWVFREARTGPAPGTVVRLEAQGKRVGWGLADEGPIAVRVLARTGEPEPVERLLLERVGRADRVRVRLIEANTDAYRVVNGPGDGLPGLVIDRYGSVAIVRVYAAAWLFYLDAIVSAVSALPWVASVARRLGVERVDGSKGLVQLDGSAVPEVLVVREGGMRLLVRPHVGQKTGLFLDQRVHRAMVGGWASGRLVANLFAYTGGFSVAAALGGAARVVTVDLAPEAVADARETFVLNGIDPDAHGFEVADAFAWTPTGRPDLLIVDPPALARGKRAEDTAYAAYRKLHRRLGPFVVRDGLLASSSCTARLPAARWRVAVAEGLSIAGEWSWHWRSSEAPDHPVALGHDEGHYLKFALLRRR